MMAPFNSTYRLQFNPEFTFTHALDVVDYLARLGITAIYASPVFHARKGSTHGYDIVDPGRLNPDLGTEKDFDELTSITSHNGLSWLQDIVPNHMAIDTDNRILMDIFETGVKSKYYHFFDIDWDHPYENMHGKMLVPLLGKLYSECLEAGEIRLKYGCEGLSITYHDISLPLRIQSYPAVFARDIGVLETELDGNSPQFLKYLGTLHLIKTVSSEDDRDVFYRQIRHIKRILFALYRENEVIRRFIDDNIAYFNGESREEGGRNALDGLISEQLFRLSFWKVAAEEINYRRFFTVNGLISVNTTEKEVFEYTHDLIFRYLDKGIFNGLRIDHIDGLLDPDAYLRRLRNRIGDRYVIVEKILQEGEHIPDDWSVQGTTGYEFLNHLNWIFCDCEARRFFSRLYYKYGKPGSSYGEILREKKRLIIEKHMAGNIDNLAQHIKRISGRDRYGQDITLFGLKRALIELIAYFPVYRTYIHNDTPRASDRRIIEGAIDNARDENPDLFYEFQFIERFFLFLFDDSLAPEEREGWIRVIMNFQQQTGPVMAKGFEDTVLYNYNRLTALNEVGGNPNRFGISLEDFHDFNKERMECSPLSLNATATHDTKRGEDTRARILVLSEIPSEWEQNLKTFSRINRTRKKKVQHRYAPDRNDEYFLYQTLLGTYPLESELNGYKARIKDYIIKAVREAKVHTAWIKPDREYEEAYLTFIDRILEDTKGNRFMEQFLPLQRKVAFYGRFNSISQTLIKMTAPGLPDFYQGCEFWDLTLVDPDNRRAVDFGRRSDSLEDLLAGFERNPGKLVESLLEHMPDGRIKQFLIVRVLGERNRHPVLFLSGRYIPIRVEGDHRNNVISFARARDDRFALTIAPRFLSRIIGEGEYPLKEQVWGNTSLILPDGFPAEWTDSITGARLLSNNDVLPVGEILSSFPAGLLVSGNE
jgi:(1->4)-alpha-D-glucan 1-alpha-D-glucosylmutase